MSVSATTHTFITHDHWSMDMGNAHPAKVAKDGDTGDKGKGLTAFAEDEPSFWDLLDVINPLQHIPIVNTIYRELTGDEIGVAARLAGGTLFGGPIGFAAAAVNAAIESETGEDAGGHLLALFRGGNAPDAPVDEPVMLAQAPQGQAPAQAQAQAQAKPEVAPEAKTAEPNMAPPQPGIVQAASAVMFDVNGPVVATANPPPPPPAPAASGPAASGPAASGEVSRLAQAQPARFMPVPPRLPEGTMRQPPPRLTVPVSNNGARSSVPLTGRDPVSNAPNATAVQKMLEAQGMADAKHPLLPAQGDQGWIAASMARSLDKYEQATQLTKKADPAEVLVQ